MGSIVALLPGNQQAKAMVDEGLRVLEEQARSSASDGSAPSSAQPLFVTDDPRLLGCWTLLYASNGTAVTRTPGVQALVAASQLPGVGIAHIRQRLSRNEDESIQASNEAEFGLGPFGQWQVALVGRWSPLGSGGGSGSGMGSGGGGGRAGLGSKHGVKVSFERLKLKPVALGGLPLPGWLPEALMSLGQGDGSPGGGAEWYTTYLDDEYRVGRGKSGNTFLFKREGGAPFKVDGAS